MTRGSQPRSTTETVGIGSDDTSPTHPDFTERTTGHTAIALISVCLGFFVIQLDVTIVNVALPAIQREIGGSLAGLQWVVDAYTLAWPRSCSLRGRPRTGSGPGRCSRPG